MRERGEREKERRLMNINRVERELDREKDGETKMEKER